MADDPIFRKMDAEELETWVPITRALRSVHKVIPYHPKAKEALVRRLAGSQIRSGAESMTFEGKQGGPCEIAPRLWGITNYDNDVFSTGDMMSFLDTPGSYRPDPENTLIFYGVRVEPSGLTRLANSPDDVAVPLSVPAPAMQPAPPTVVAPGKRGPKGYQWWDEMWAHLCRRIADGWRPVAQTEIEAVMLEFAEKHEPGIATSTIRKRAQPLARAFGLKVDN